MKSVALWLGPGFSVEPDTRCHDSKDNDICETQRMNQ